MGSNLSAPQKVRAQAQPSNRSFGFLFVLVFSAIGCWGWWKGSSWAPWPFLAGAVLATITLAASDLLTPFNRAWMALAEVLHRLVSPIILGILFYGIVTPFGWARRLLGGDPLARCFEPGRDSYWVERKPPGPPPDSFPHQF